MPKEAQLDFSSVTISYFIHATEDERRLNESVCSSFGLEEGVQSLEQLQSHYGNSLISATIHITGSTAGKMAKNILRQLDDSSKSALLSDLEKHLDEHDALYLRIDRQTIGEHYYMTDEEPVRIKLKPRARAGGRNAIQGSYAELIRR